MGFWSSVGSAVSSFVSSVGNVIGSVASSIGSSLSGVAGSLLKIAVPWLGPVIDAVQSIATLLGVLAPNEKVEELGDKAINSDKKPEDFDSNAKYIEYIRNEIEFDKEKFDKLSDTEKNARKVIGTSIAIKGIEEKKGFEIPVETWVSLGKLNIKNSKEIDSILNNFSDSKFDNFNKYVDGELGAKDEISIGNSLVEMYQKLEPELSKQDIEDKVMKMDLGQ